MEPSDDEMEYALLTKSDHWKDEQEWRLVVPAEAGKYLAFNPQSLVGCRTAPGRKSISPMHREPRRAALSNCSKRSGLDVRTLQTTSATQWRPSMKWV
jgi:hypothetical protein